MKNPFQMSQDRERLMTTDNYPDFVFIAYDGDENSDTYEVAASLEPGNLVGKPVRYVRHDVNSSMYRVISNIEEDLKELAKSISGEIYLGDSAELGVVENSVQALASLKKRMLHVDDLTKTGIVAH